MPTSRDTDSGNSDIGNNVFGNNVFGKTNIGNTDFGNTDSGNTDIEAEGGLTIDCDCCALRNTEACDDCVVSFLLEREPDDAVVIDADEARAMRMLEHAGLVPTLRFSARVG